MFFFKELLEPVARYFRFFKAEREIDKNRSVILLDLGCGKDLSFFIFCQKRGIRFKKYIGVDPLLQEKKEWPKEVEIFNSSLLKSVPLKTKTVDYVVGLAFLEHVNNPKIIINETIRVLKNNGKAIFTTPSKRAKKLLEFLAYKLNLLSQREIREHKIYFDKKDLLGLVEKESGLKIKHRFFEFGLNSLVTIRKAGKE